MRLAAWFGFIIIAAAYMSAPALAQSSDDDLKVYAVNVVKTAPFEKQFTGYGIYLGHGAIITAAHVVGHWPALTNPRVIVAGMDLPAKVIKEGSFEQTDLALLSVDKERLPVSLRLRRNPLCKEAPAVGTNVVIVYPERTVRSQIISPFTIAPQYQARFGSSLINEAEGSGSGVFHADKRCLLGIISSKITKFKYRKVNGRLFVSGQRLCWEFCISVHDRRFHTARISVLISLRRPFHFSNYIATLVERHTRYVMLARVPNTRTGASTTT